jgi:NAD(P)-dependent dehydrogenase (short-subunit alcohol dehydrogenase family)
MNGKTVLITGGNSGIGRATAVELAKRGAHVIITARDEAKGAKAAEAIEAESGGAVEVRALDLASFDSIRRFAEGFLRDHAALHVLINNAGLVLSARQTTAEGLEATFGVNHIGHFLLTSLLLPLLRDSAPARIVNLSSDAHLRAKKGLDFGDLNRERGYRGFHVYSESKLANVYFTRELARRLEGTGVTVYAVHPGVVRTGFSLDGDTRGPVAWFFRLAGPVLRTPAQGASTSIWAATAPELEHESGRYYKDRREAKISRPARDDVAATRLWAVSEAIIEAGGPVPSTGA